MPDLVPPGLYRSPSSSSFSGAAEAVQHCPRCGSKLKQRVVFMECPGCGYKEPIAPRAEETQAPRRSYWARVTETWRESRPETPEQLWRLLSWELPGQLTAERFLLGFVLLAQLLLVYFLYRSYAGISTPELEAILAYMRWIIVVPTLLTFGNLLVPVRPFKIIGVAWGFLSAIFSVALLLNATGLIAAQFLCINHYSEVSRFPAWGCYEMVLYQAAVGLWSASYFSREYGLLERK